MQLRKVPEFWPFVGMIYDIHGQAGTPRTERRYLRFKKWQDGKARKGPESTLILQLIIWLHARPASLL